MDRDGIIIYDIRIYIYRERVWYIWRETIGGWVIYDVWGMMLRIVRVYGGSRIRERWYVRLAMWW